MSRIKVLITGGHGLVGSRFVELVKDFDLVTPDKHQLDVTDLSSVQALVEKENPDWIINFAAFTDVDAAELQVGDESGSAWRLNVSGVENLFSAFKSKNFIQISTDMVFPGDLTQPGPYDEADLPPTTQEKLTWYGWTKNRAEKLVSERGGNILRLIYPVRSHFDAKPDYLRAALDKFVQGKLPPLFSDQQISISFIDEAVGALQKIIKTDSSGVFHASSDTTTPYELISYTLDQLGADTSSLRQTSLVEFLKTQNNHYRYPVWGGLRIKKTEDVLEIHFSTWQTVVEYLIGQGLDLPKV